MRIFRIVILAAVCCGAPFAPAQNGAQQATEASCFRISIDLDDTPVPDSMNVYLLRKGRLDKLPQVDGCFQLPKGFRETEKVDVKIEVGQDSLSLPGVPPGYLGRPWSIALSDKTNLVQVGSKHYKASQVCGVSVRGGETQTGFITAPCRSSRHPSQRH